MAKVLGIQDIPIEQFIPNPWNSNVMTPDVFQHLKREYLRVGNLQPVVARWIGEHAQLIDGEHRWKMAKEMGPEYMEPTLKAVIVEMTDEEAKLTTINMNKIKGADDPICLAYLLKDLAATMPMENIASALNFNLDELKATIDLSSLPNIEDLDMTAKDRIITCPHCKEEINLNLLTLERRKTKNKKENEKAATDAPLNSISINQIQNAGGKEASAASVSKVKTS